MNDKNKKIIEYLLETKTWTTSHSIANKLDVSVRTVKTYISNLNNEYPGIIEASRDGYCVNSGLAIKVLNSENAIYNIPQTNKERTLYLITKLLREEEYLDIDSFCNEIFISLSTYKNIIKMIKHKLDDYNLSIITENNKIKIDGNENDKKRLLIDTIFTETEFSYFDISSIQSVFTNIDTDYTINTLKDILWNNQQFASDLVVTPIVLHIIIAIDRNISNNNEIKAHVEYPSYVSEKIITITEELVDKLEQYYCIYFTDEEILEFALLLSMRTYSFESAKLTEENINDYLGDEARDIILQLFDELKNTYNIEFNNDESKIFFCIHIKNLILRSRVQSFSKNPLKTSIKSSAPLIYDIATALSKIISSHTGVNLPDDEISYIAFHIGNAIEAQKTENSKIKTAIYCPNYYKMEVSLRRNITDRFESDIIIDNVFTSQPSKSKLAGIELLITTVPLTKKVSTLDIIHISMFLNSFDVLSIEKAINRIKEENKKNTFNKLITEMTNEKFYKRVSSYDSKKDAIKDMCDELITYGYANSEFYKDVLEREVLSSTSFNNFAIPHTIKLRQNKSCISICIVDNPVMWGREDVSVIFMLCLANKDKDNFYTIFETISNLLMNKTFVQKIIETHNYDELLDLLTNHNKYLY